MCTWCACARGAGSRWFGSSADSVSTQHSNIWVDNPQNASEATGIFFVNLCFFLLLPFLAGLPLIECGEKKKQTGSVGKDVGGAVLRLRSHQIVGGGNELIDRKWKHCDTESSSR